MVEEEKLKSFPHEVVGLEIKFDNLMKAWRTHLKVSQEQLAKRAGISQAALSELEKSGVKPDAAILEKIAQALSISPELLES